MVAGSDGAPRSGPSTPVLRNRDWVKAMVRLGFHVSISGSIDKSVDRALGLGCDSFQIFTRNPRSWGFRNLKEGEVGAFREKRRSSGLDPVYDHMPYILNLASPDDGIYSKSVGSLAAELRRCTMLGVPYVITHIGSHLGSGAERGVERVVSALDRVLQGDGSGVAILLENGSGSANKVGSRFEELGLILEGVGWTGRVGVCLDTCHAYAAGYDLGTGEGLAETIDTFDGCVGLDRLGVVHLNDSVGALGSGVDHHEHIGLGEIGRDGFRLILGSRLSRVPMIMETPVDVRRGNEGNMDVARSLAAGVGG